MSGDVGTHSGLPEDTFAVEKLLTWSKREELNYWLAPDNKTGAQFILDLGQLVKVRNIVLVNTHNGNKRDRSTKGFMVSLAFQTSGPWEQVLKQELPDNRNYVEPAPPKIIEIYPTEARFVKFELLSFWGKGGGLQYFAVNG